MGKIEDILRRLRYFIREFKSDIVTTLITIVLAILAFLFAPQPTLIYSIIIVLFGLVVLIFLKHRDKDFYFIPLRNIYDNKDDWIGRGKFEYYRSQKCFVITDSESGYIYSKSIIWSDYTLSTEFKIIKDCFGVVMRAVNLSNYVMLQIRDYGIRPHIRINGAWKKWEANEANLEFTKKLSFDKWYKLTTSVDKDSVNIKIFDTTGKIVFDRGWNIPSGRIAMPFPKSEDDKNPLLIHFPIILEYGSFGFRNSGQEKALIKNILIEKF